MPNLLVFGGVRPVGRSVVIEALKQGGYDLIRVIDRAVPETEWMTDGELRLLNHVEVMQVNIGSDDDKIHMERIFRNGGGYHWDVVVNAYFDMRLFLDARTCDMHTVRPSGSIGKAANDYGCGVVIHLSPMAYIHWDSRSGPLKDDATISPWEHSTRSRAYIQSEKAMRVYPDLPLVVLRLGDMYGLGALGGTSSMLKTVRTHQESQRGFFRSPFVENDKMNTVHLLDVARATLHAAAWYRRERITGGRTFNVCDMSDSSFFWTAQTVCEVIGIKCVQLNPILRTLACAVMRSRFIGKLLAERDMVNWPMLLSRSGIQSCPITAHMNSEVIRTNWAMQMDGRRFREETGFTLAHPEYTVETVRGALDYWREVGVWPEYIPVKGVDHPILVPEGEGGGGI